MKKLISIMIIVFLLTACEAPINHFQANNQRAINTCISKGGIPLLESNGVMRDCKFSEDFCKGQKQ